MKNRDGLENSDNWATPKWLYKILDKEFSFNFDPCPLNPAPTFDGTAPGLAWGSSTYCNPPYSRGEAPCQDNCTKKACPDRGYHISKRIAGKDDFIDKAFEQWQQGKTVVMLIPAATGTEKFHALIAPHAEVRFFKGRIAFEGVNTKGEHTTTNKGKHDSMLVIFRGPEHAHTINEHEGTLWHTFVRR